MQKVGYETKFTLSYHLSLSVNGELQGYSQHLSACREGEKNPVNLQTS